MPMLMIANGKIFGRSQPKVDMNNLVHAALTLHVYLHYLQEYYCQL